jgi:hypothetical protein
MTERLESGATEPFLRERTRKTWSDLFLSVYLEANPDTYKRSGNPLAAVIELASSSGYLEMLDMNLVLGVLRKRDGIARDVTRRSTKTKNP